MKVNRFYFFSICLLSILLFKALPVYGGSVGISVFIDIKPNSCPNPLNCKGGGFISVAILGTDSFDVNDIDPSTLRISGTFATHSNIEDVATPFEGELADCSFSSCTEDGPDTNSHTYSNEINYTIPYKNANTYTNQNRNTNKNQNSNTYTN